MSQRTWDIVDQYFTSTLALEDAVLMASLAASEAAGLPSISVSAPQGAMLNLFARMVGARRILEIGTLGGYSAIWLARALPADGLLVTLELDPGHAAVAEANLRFAGLGAKVEVRLGAASETLPRLHAEGAGPFDFAFIDADKASNPLYLEWALRMSRPGTLIVIDNVVRRGAVADAASGDANVRGVRGAIELLASNPRLDATAIQTVGLKGYDGFAMALVLGP